MHNEKRIERKELTLFNICVFACSRIRVLAYSRIRVFTCVFAFKTGGVRMSNVVILDALLIVLVITRYDQ